MKPYESINLPFYLMLFILLSQHNLLISSGLTLADLAQKLELSHHGHLVAIHHGVDGHMTLKVIHDRPFMCVVCGASFRQGMSLVEHSKAEHDYCGESDGKSYTNREILLILVTLPGKYAEPAFLNEYRYRAKVKLT